MMTGVQRQSPQFHRQAFFLREDKGTLENTASWHSQYKWVCMDKMTAGSKGEISDAKKSFKLLLKDQKKMIFTLRIQLVTHSATQSLGDVLNQLSVLLCDGVWQSLTQTDALSTPNSTHFVSFLKTLLGKAYSEAL